VLRTNLFDSDAVTSVDDVVFVVVTEDRAVLRRDMNRDLLLKGGEDMVNNQQAQFAEIVRSPPLFATFHLGGNVAEAAEEVRLFLRSQFPAP
jgi:hypothetical protein